MNESIVKPHLAANLRINSTNIIYRIKNTTRIRSNNILCSGLIKTYAIVFGSTIAMTTLTSNGFFAIAIIVHGSNSGIVIEIFGMRKRNTYVVLFH